MRNRQTRNTELDRVERASANAIKKQRIASAARAQALRNPEIKAMLMDFIAGRSTFNPMDNLRFKNGKATVALDPDRIIKERDNFERESVVEVEEIQATGRVVPAMEGVIYEKTLDGKKVCRSCQESKVSTKFYASKRTSDRLESTCKCCRALRATTLKEEKAAKIAA